MTEGGEKREEERVGGERRRWMKGMGEGVGIKPRSVKNRKVESVREIRGTLKRFDYISHLLHTYNLGSIVLLNVLLF